MPVSSDNKLPATILVTGGAGFIGANLVGLLLQDDDVAEVRVLDDGTTGFFENLPTHDRLHVFKNSLLERDAVDAAVAGTTSVVHLGALPSVPRSIDDPMRSHAINVNGTMNVLDAVRRLDGQHLVFASSSSVYGSNPILPKVESLATRPMSPYAASKLAAEAYCLAFGHSFKFPVTAFRFFNVFGPLQAAGHAYAAVIPQFIAAAMAGQPLPVNGDGTQTRDFTYVGTVVKVLADAAKRQVSSSDPVNLAFGSRVSLLEVIALLEQRLGRKLPLEHRPSRQGDVPHSQADCGLLTALFADVTPVPFEEGLDATLSWFQNGEPRPNL